MEQGNASGGVRQVLRLEGACVLGLCLLAWARLDGSWGVFALCFLLPDLAMLGYLGGARAGALAYNLAHAYPLPLLLLGAGGMTGQRMLLLAGLLWAAHIGFDRMLGYGLKYARGFGFTHLGRIGRAGG